MNIQQRFAELEKQRNAKWYVNKHIAHFMNKFKRG